jgi:ribonucleoside-diphosphate reductase alpha chain
MCYWKNMPRAMKPRSMMCRVARALASVEQADVRAYYEEKFLWAQKNGFVPAGRINSAAGMDLRDPDQLLCTTGR